MIKSKEEFDRIANLFGKDGKIWVNQEKEFLRYLKEGDRLKKIIEIWNEEEEKISDSVEARGFSWKLRSARRLFLKEYPDLSLPEIKFSDTLKN